ncbi:nucleotidyltransferase domain-containing protein [Halobacillus naozhouensis]|uniref:Nucleotidyltransferase domain-containing protein n=1 Tax=Halobacillus naozhouensis TaxID=554880 RepID=A0ABY8J491_9BACI|nr:nucleotidyltransferase domain-containing protein [Halobacillus naozhouensis]WFT75776.1 nucleotidyltransferase domain-containing protein [Halobacillus naozhouensis]
MRQEEAVKVVTESLRKDERVKAVFLKGSMGRGESDEHSDVDLYCLVEEQDEEDFLQDRMQHLEEYREILIYDDIFIIAPQVIAVYDNLLHMDLFTVTERTLLHKDYFKVLHDPEGRMEKFRPYQHLRLSKQDFVDVVDDAAFFLLQYKKSAGRGNDFWCVKVLNDVMVNATKILLHHYCPDRAQLGLKTAERSLPEEWVAKLQYVYQRITVNDHTSAATLAAKILAREFKWIFNELSAAKHTATVAFLKRMIEETCGGISEEF